MGGKTGREGPGSEWQIPLLMIDSASFKSKAVISVLGRKTCFWKSFLFQAESTCTCVTGPSDSHVGVAFFFFFLKIKRK